MTPNVTLQVKISLSRKSKWNGLFEHKAEGIHINFLLHTQSQIIPYFVFEQILLTITLFRNIILQWHITIDVRRFLLGLGKFNLYDHVLDHEIPVTPATSLAVSNCFSTPFLTSVKHVFTIHIFTANVFKKHRIFYDYYVLSTIF